MASKVKKTIVNKIKCVKYSAILLHCTEDADLVERKAIILRYDDTETGCIEEHFVGFIAVQETTAAALTHTILKELQSIALDTNDCRGQDCDNGTNIAGVNSGVKTKILAISPRAFFTACGCHSWKMLLGDTAKSSRWQSDFLA
jgi:hypothetical protein